MHFAPQLARHASTAKPAQPLRRRSMQIALISWWIDICKGGAAMSPLLAAFVFTSGFFSTLFVLARWELNHQKR
jgi:hypothetical protein